MRSNEDITNIWTNELSQAKTLVDTLRNLNQDIAFVQGKSPFEVMHESEQSLKQLKYHLQTNPVTQPLDCKKHVIEVSELMSQIDTLLAKLHTLLTSQQIETDKITHNLVRQYSRVINRVVEHYKQKKQFSLGVIDTNFLFKKGTFTIFEHNVDPHQKTWVLIQARLKQFSDIADHKNTQHHALSQLFIPQDEIFIDAIDKGHIALGEEVGFLALQRLKEIAKSATSTHRMKRVANLAIENAVISPESLFRYNDVALKSELEKLVLYALIHPNNKIILLGTARTVNAAIISSPGEAIYFNPDNKQYSWALNRAWLLAAMKLGYEFKLVEQHFPDVENAILSGDICQFIAQLAREIRPEGSTSQYNGGDAPTATTQEILVLLDAGCVAKKNKEGCLSLFPAKTTQEEQIPILIKKGRSPLKRYHSSPHLFKSAPLPPLSDKRDHFTSPDQTQITLFSKVRI